MAIGEVGSTALDIFFTGIDSLGGCDGVLMSVAFSIVNVLACKGNGDWVFLLTGSLLASELPTKLGRLRSG